MPEQGFIGEIGPNTSIPTIRYLESIIIAPTHTTGNEGIKQRCGNVSHNQTSFLRGVRSPKKRGCARLPCAYGVQAGRRARNSSIDRRNWRSCSTSLVPVVELEEEARQCFVCWEMLPEQVLLAR